MKDKKCFGIKARFDVVAVSIGSGKPKFEIIKNAFDLAY